MNKNDYIKLSEEWIMDFINFHYKDENLSIEIHNRTKLSSISEGLIKEIDGHSLFDFTPDIFVIFKTNDNNIEFFIINVSTESISLKEIGEMNLYTKIAKPKYSMIISLKGIAKEVNLVLSNEDKEKSLLEVGDGSYVSIFQLNESKEVKEERILPFSKRQEILMINAGE